jgi:CubicO group peptidase (beta-lactamase class C family)
VQEGKIDLDRTIRTYLPDYTGEAGDRATIAQLLHHTSGIRNLDAGLTSYEQARRTGIEHYQRPFTLSELVARYCSGPLVHEPGKVFDYNNGEYLVLGLIIEKLGGKPLAEVLKQRITGPLQMADTGFADSGRLVPNLAPTYYTNDAGRTFIPDMPVYFENWSAAGAMYSTAEDLLRFDQALFGGRLLKPDTLGRLLTPGLGGYGCGVWVSTATIGRQPYQVVNRPGSIMGANALLRHWQGTGSTAQLNLIVLTNTNGSELAQIARVVAETVLKP